MNYLNDRITQRIDLGTAQAKGVYKYEILVTDLADQSGKYVVFVGSYYNSGTRYYTFDITDVVRGRKTNHMRASESEKDCNQVEQYWIRVTLDDDQTVTSSAMNVAHVYTYPNVPLASYSKTSPNSVFFDPTYANRLKSSVLLQGYNRFQRKTTLLPHYPHLNNEQDYSSPSYPFAIMLEVGSAVTDNQIALIAVERGEDPDDQSARICEVHPDHIAYDSYAHLWFLDIGDLLYNIRGVQDDIDIYLYNSSDDAYALVARVDACHPRYYLMWQDRFGSFQCQPFNDKTKFTETITNGETVSYTDKRYKNSAIVQPKWHIDSGWIPEDNFVFYESLYISPYLKLIDSKIGKAYDVIMKGDYVEKTFKDEKKMLNISLDLEATEKQNIIY